MAKAIWKDAVLAESDHTVVVEGNQYFPSDSSACRISAAERNSYSVPVEGNCQLSRCRSEWRENPDAAWYYPAPNLPRPNQRPRRVLEGRSRRSVIPACAIVSGSMAGKKKKASALAPGKKSARKKPREDRIC